MVHRLFEQKDIYVYQTPQFASFILTPLLLQGYQSNYDRRNAHAYRDDNADTRS
jgi:hypothetical protein